MATKTKTAKTEPPYASAVDKEPTNMQSRFATWLEENTGYEVDVTSVQLATALRTQFQNSDENQAYLAERKAAREAEQAERAEKKPAKSTKGKAKSAPAEDVEEDEGNGDTEEAAPAKAPRKRAAAKKATVPKVETETPKRRRPARRVNKPADEETEDF